MEDTLVRCKAIYRLYRRKFRSTANYVKNNKPAFYWSILSATTLMISTCLLLLVTFFAVRIGIIGNVPSSSDLNDIRNYEASQALDTSGKTLGKYYIQNRLNADFEEINEHTIQALVSTEDSRFYKHQGIDYRSWLRVFFKSILLNDKSSGGGSTISQQLAKNLYPRQDYPILGIIINKFREFIIARRLEKIYAKNDILKLYLNTVPFSENIYGIKVAAQRFYNKAPKYLKMDEA
ncbi:MAG: transglycosylase domain-containing protein, partial [Bacteroidia bacterium]|nr:transglycosylase domain-containing protein [Bacteroidia bacterium]